jgi:hypothetical protein
MQNKYHVAEKADLNQKGLFANKLFVPGEIISDFSSSKILDKPNFLTVQLSENTHILLEPMDLQYINHSCSPNCYFDTSSMKLMALVEIKESEEFSFFYPSTEWDMDQTFVCRCKKESCIREIKGAKYLSLYEFRRNKFSEYIKNKYEQYYLKQS